MKRAIAVFVLLVSALLFSQTVASASEAHYRYYTVTGAN